jgi:predicted nucleotidyltransferase
MPNMGTIIPNMGIMNKIKQGSPGLAGALFTTTQQRVLANLFGQPGRSFYATELIGLTGGGSGAVQRELARLAESGLVTVTKIGNQKHYQANPESPIFPELCGIVRKTIGLVDPIRSALEPLQDRIHMAFVYGSVAKKEDTAASDIDLMVISDHLTYGEVFAVLESAEGQLNRPVNPTVYSWKEFEMRIKKDNAFVKRVISRDKIWVIGTENDLAAG